MSCAGSDPPGAARLRGSAVGKQDTEMQHSPVFLCLLKISYRGAQQCRPAFQQQQGRGGGLEGSAGLAVCRAVQARGAACSPRPVVLSCQAVAVGPCAAGMRFEASVLNSVTNSCCTQWRSFRWESGQSEQGLRRHSEGQVTFTGWRAAERIHSSPLHFLYQDEPTWGFQGLISLSWGNKFSQACARGSLSSRDGGGVLAGFRQGPYLC